MKGLLHRLAARAAGTAVVVRSDARLPYGAVGLDGGDAPDNPMAWAPEEVASVAAPPPVPAQPSPSNVEASDQEGQVGAVLHEPAALRPAVPDASPLAREAPPLRRAHASTQAVEPVAAPETPAARRIDPPPQPMLPPAAALAGPAAKRSEPAAMPPEPSSRRARVAAEPAGDESPDSPRVASVADPAPASPQPATAAPHESAAARLSGPAQPQMAWPLASSASAADAATEVHIHIGRIDVTAVHEAPKVRVKPAARSPSLSLDAYLAGRSKA